jgi:hypothetical protein
MRTQLATILSGFANTSGGVLVYGLSTTRHSHSGLDIITQVEPIGHCRRFQQQLATAIPSLTSPPIRGFDTKVVTEKAGDTKGVVIVHVPPTQGDPVQSNIDNIFYFRSGDEIRAAPHDMIRRLFAGSTSPDVYPIFSSSLVRLNPDGTWSIPITVENRSSATARDITVSVTVLNPGVCQTITPPSTFKDASAVNPGTTIYMNDVPSVLHRGLNLNLGAFLFAMKVGKRPRRRLDLRINVYADRMRPRSTEVVLTLAKRGFAVKRFKEGFQY